MKKIILAIVIFISACSSIQKSQFAQFQLRPFQEETLENGLRIIFIEDQSLPIVHMSLLVQAGSLNESSGDEGLNFLTANLLEQGSNNRSATLIADSLGQIAAEFQVGPGVDYTLLNISTLSNEKKKMLELYTDILLNPSFQLKEIERAREQQLAMIKKAQDNPSGFADQILDRVVFGSHPYAMPAYGNEKSVKSFNRSDIMKFYLKSYRPNNSILSVTGKFDDNYKKQVRAAFSGWQKRDITQLTDRSQKIINSGSLKLFTKPGLQQSQVRFAHIGIKRSDADYLKLRLAFMILGGSFSSRLNQKIRDDLGLTYSIHSSVDARKEVGSFEISTFTRNEKLAETIIETKKMLNEFANDGVSSTEVESAKALMAGQFPSAIETMPKFAQNLMLLRFYGISDDYLKNYNSNLERISKDEINKAIKTYFQPGKMQIIVYADEMQVNEQMKKVGEFTTDHVDMLKQ